tara:strand:+ start:277 stop:432 length:156 start_codon:yes stop_codon:yes gene_type:complete
MIDFGKCPQIEKACRELEQERADSAKRYQQLLAQAGKGELVKYYDGETDAS